ncbi:hypothetical protein [Roseovarius litorisediminis]|uniref:hypothetical protein n=1 Tax=Roseovarius litorisediminis TaxID=1312363 RepID=UPI0027960CB6|nr:hypothetical protein [Roseovarius litorisediminis]
MLTVPLVDRMEVINFNEETSSFLIGFSGFGQKTIQRLVDIVATEFSEMRRILVWVSGEEMLENVLEKWKSQRHSH